MELELKHPASHNPAIIEAMTELSGKITEIPFAYTTSAEVYNSEIRDGVVVVVKGRISMSRFVSSKEMMEAESGIRE